MILGPFSLDRMVLAVERVRERLLRATAALEQAGIAFAVAGGHAVAFWVTLADLGGVRNTPDVDLLVRRSDLEAIRSTLEAVGFIFQIDLFLDGPEAKARDAVHLVFANEKVRAEELLPNPDVTDSVMTESYRVLSLEALVQIKLTAFRIKDRMHLRDLIDVGLIDSSWVDRYPPQLRERLQSILDTPEG